MLSYRDFTQWPLPSLESSSPITSNRNVELARNQVEELKKKMAPIQQMIISLQPKKKVGLIGYIPNFDDYEHDDNANDNDTQLAISSIETYENVEQESLSQRLYNEIDGRTTGI